MAVQEAKEFLHWYKKIRDIGKPICLAIAYGRQLDDQQPDFEIATAFLYHHRGVTTLVLK